jgi:hypothetical protein
MVRALTESDSLVLLASLALFSLVVRAVATQRPKWLLGWDRRGNIGGALGLYGIALTTLGKVLFHAREWSESHVMVGAFTFGFLFASATITLVIIQSHRESRNPDPPNPT